MRSWARSEHCEALLRFFSGAAGGGPAFSRRRSPTRRTVAGRGPPARGPRALGSVDEGEGGERGRRRSAAARLVDHVGGVRRAFAPVAAGIGAGGVELARRALWRPSAWGMTKNRGEVVAEEGAALACSRLGCQRRGQCFTDHIRDRQRQAARLMVARPPRGAGHGRHWTRGRDRRRARRDSDPAQSSVPCRATPAGGWW